MTHTDYINERHAAYIEASVRYKYLAQTAIIYIDDEAKRKELERTLIEIETKLNTHLSVVDNLFTNKNK